MNKEERLKIVVELLRNEQDTYINLEDISKNKNKSLMWAHTLLIELRTRISVNKIDLLEEASVKSELGEKYAKLAIEKNNKYIMASKRLKPLQAKWLQYYCFYIFKWFNTGKEDIEILKDSSKYLMDFVDELYEKNSTKKKIYCFQVVKQLVEIGEFNLAREYFDKMFKRKKSQKLDKSIIYTPELFLDYILEYLSNSSEKEDLKDFLEECFEEWFSKRAIYEKKIIKAWSKELLPISEFTYIYFKYFSELKWKEVFLIRLIQSRRYGIEDLNYPEATY